MPVSLDERLLGSSNKTMALGHSEESGRLGKASIKRWSLLTALEDEEEELADV